MAQQRLSGEAGEREYEHEYGFVPIAESPEWRAAAQQWSGQGVLPFLNGGVPFWINNSGHLSEDATALLFAVCEQTNSTDGGPIHAVELGAGTGLFARYLLDQFEALCRQSNRDYYDRLDFLITDFSAATVAHRRACGIFDPHLAHLRLEAAAAESVPVVNAHAVFANYVLDVLPATVVDRAPDGTLRELRVRGSETQLALFSPTPIQAELLRYAAPGRQTLNYGAVETVRRAVAGLAPHGFVLINDFGAVRQDEAAELAVTQRFGGTTAVGLNFPLLARFFTEAGCTVLVAKGDGELPIHSRLIAKQPDARLREEYLTRFHRDARTTPNPRDWTELGRAAEHALTKLNDPGRALELAQAAVARNPWYSGWLWNVLGESLVALGRPEHAHEAFLRAERIDPDDARTCSNEIAGLIRNGRHPAALQATARGLANDPGHVYRERLLAAQQQILKVL